MTSRNRDSVGYWIAIGAYGCFTVFASGIAAMMLSISLSGRTKGGASLKGGVTAVVLLWLGGLYSWGWATWAARNIPARPTIYQLARGPLPGDPIARAVRRSARRAAALMLAFLCGLLAMALLSTVGR